MYTTPYIFLSYMSVDSFIGITGVWTFGSKPDALAWHRLKVFLPICPLPVRAVTKRMFVSILSEEKSTSLWSAAIPSVWCSLLIKAGWCFPSALLLTCFSGRIKPSAWGQEYLQAWTLSPFLQEDAVKLRTASPEPCFTVQNWPSSYWAPEMPTLLLYFPRFPSQLPSELSIPPESFWQIIVSVRGSIFFGNTKIYW